MIDTGRLENAIRKHLNKVAPRRNAVLDPLKLTITNWPADKVEIVEAINNPEDPAAGSRELPFSRTLFIEQDDFQEDAPKKFFRLKKGGAVRLRYGYILDCHDVVKDESGKVIEVLCTYDPDTRSGSDRSGRKVKGTIHWVSAPHAVDLTVRMYDRLFKVENPEKGSEGGSFLDHLNENSLTTITVKGEPSLAELEPGDRVQFERKGYFCVDKDSVAGQPIYNQIVGLRDSWAKEQAKG